MKLCAPKSLATLSACLCAAAGLLSLPVGRAQTSSDETPPALGAATPPSVGNTPPAVSPPATPKPAKKPKGPPDPNATPRPPKVKKPKEIQFPLTLNSEADHITIPENSDTGTLLMNLIAFRMKRISNELVEMHETTVDVNHPDGSEDFHIQLPTSVFNLQTRIINSEQPVTVRTQDFELTGEKMEFNTVDRTGKLLGHVHMLIHNLKQVAGPQPAPKPSE